MTALEAIIAALGTGGFGAGVLALIKQWQRDGRTKRAGDARVAIAEIGAGTRGMEILAEQIDELRASQTAERDECRQSLVLIRADLAAEKTRGEECERRTGKLQTQLNRLRSWMRQDPDDREDLTPVEGKLK